MNQIPGESPREHPPAAATLARPSNSVARRRMAVGFGIGLAAVVGFGVWVRAAKDQPDDWRGISVVAIIQGPDNVSGPYLDCRGVGEFSSFRPGQPASLLDTDGKLVAVTTIGGGEDVIDKLANEEQLMNNETGLVVDIERRARAKVSRPLAEASGRVCAVHLQFGRLGFRGLYTVEVGTHRFPVDLAQAPLFNSVVWNVN